MLVAVLQADGMDALLHVTEDRAQGVGEGRRALGGPDHQRPSDVEPVEGGAQERLVVQGRVRLVHELAGAVVDVEQHHVVRRRAGLGDGAGDVGDDDASTAVRQEPGPVGDRSVAHPLDQGRLDLDHVDVLDAAVAEDPVESEAEPQSGHQYPLRFVDHGEGGVRKCLLGGVLGGVHDEDAVRAEFQYGRTATRVFRAGAALA